MGKMSVSEYGMGRCRVTVIAVLEALSRFKAVFLSGMGGVAVKNILCCGGVVVSAVCIRGRDMRVRAPGFASGGPLSACNFV